MIQQKETERMLDAKTWSYTFMDPPLRVFNDGKESCAKQWVVTDQVKVHHTSQTGFPSHLPYLYQSPQPKTCQDSQCSSWH